MCGHICGWAHGQCMDGGFASPRIVALLQQKIKRYTIGFFIFEQTHFHSHHEARQNSGVPISIYLVYYIDI